METLKIGQEVTRASDGATGRIAARGCYLESCWVRWAGEPDYRLEAAEHLTKMGKEEGGQPR